MTSNSGCSSRQSGMPYWLTRTAEDLGRPLDERETPALFLPADFRAALDLLAMRPTSLYLRRSGKRHRLLSLSLSRMSLYRCVVARYNLPLLSADQSAEGSGI